MASDYQSDAPTYNSKGEVASSTTRGTGYKPPSKAASDLAEKKIYDMEGPKMSDFGAEDDIVARSKWNKARSAWLENKKQKEALK